MPGSCVIPTQLKLPRVGIGPRRGNSVKVPNGYCPNHATGVRLPDDFALPVQPLQYVE